MSMGVSALAADANPAESQVYISNIYLVEDGIYYLAKAATASALPN